MKFEDLRAWQEARRLVSEVYGLTRKDRLVRDFGLTSQIQRAAVSIMTNLAEGFERLHVAEKLQFCNVARASTGEVRSLLYVIQDNYPEHAELTERLLVEVKEVGKVISGLIASTQRRKSKFEV